MKTILMVALTLMGFATFGQPIPNAGKDQVIYLAQTNSATLDASASSGSSFQWREISTDFSSGGTITSPTSKTTTVIGLTKQGTFYFELAATTGGTIKRDSMVLRVNYDFPPIGTLSNNFDMGDSRISNVINWRGDTTSFFPDNDQLHSQTGDAANKFDATNWWILYRDRVNTIGIDSLRGKLTTTIEDGYGVGSTINGTQVRYPRTEVVIDKPSSIDTSHIYMYEWKGYFPQQPNYLAGNASITTIFQIHTNSSYGENTSDFALKADGTIAFTLFPNGAREEKFAVGNLSDWTNKSHTVRLTIREGYGAPGNPAFIKLDIDGKQMLLRDTGRIGGTVDGEFGDFAKFGTLYDYGNAMVDANQPGRGRKFSLVTESFKRYVLTSLPPLTNAGKNQIIILPSTSGTLNGTVTPVTSNVSSYQWTKISGGTAVITNPNSLSTTMTGLSEGSYIFNLKATDVNGLESNSTVQYTVDEDRTIAATGYNYDVLVDGVLNGFVSSLRNHDIDGSGFSFYVNGFSPISTPLPSQYALPLDGVIVSPTNTRYKFQPYNSNNALWLSNNQSGTLSLTTPASFDKIKIALTSGGTFVNYQINYSDGSNDVISDSIGNWACRGCTGYAINNLGRIDANGTLGTSYWAIYEDSIHPNPNKLIKSINLKSNGSWLSVFALTSVPDSISNIAPTANAGSDQSITLPTNSITLNGSGIDSDGTIASYVWTKVSGPSTYTISNASTATTSVKGLLTGVYVFRLTVTDDQGASGTSSVTITVNPAANIAPTANAGSDQSITLPTNSITLNGSGIDSDGTIASYVWTKVSGPSTYTISNASTATTSVKGLLTGVYVFRLTVTDDQGASGTSSVTITVNPAANIAPTANAGSDQSITLPTNSITLNGSGIDSDGTISLYSWTKISGPSSFNISNSSSAVTTVSGLVQGVYLLELKVTDDKGAMGKDTVRITVNAANNIAPKAIAGTNKVITLPVNSVVLSGSGTDSDGTITAYSWTKVSGPSAFSIKNSSSAASEVSGLVEGVYQFELKVSDNKGAIGKDTVQITVNAAKNISPTAQAGSNQSITLPTNAITLDGSGVDSDGTITSYIWTEISGPSKYNIANPLQAVTSVSNLIEGVYLFELKVTDDKGATGTDTIQITVNKTNITVIVPTPNIAPVANAGNDTTALSPVNSIVLNGSGNDIDGTITGYVWTQVSGPSQATLLASNAASTTATNLIAGTYEFELKVTDNGGAGARDTVKVTIALARTAQETSTSLKVYPNPVHNMTNVQFNTQNENSRVTIIVTDILGTMVYQKEFVSNTKDVKKQIDMSSLGKGTYLITGLIDGVVKESAKVVKM